MEHAARLRLVGSPRRGPQASSTPPEDGSRVASHLGGPLLVLGSSASLQSSAALATTVFAVYGPLGTGALRFAFAAPMLMLVARPALRGRSRAFWLTTGGLGATLVALNVTLYEAIARLPLGTVVTLQFLGPIALALAGVRRRLDAAWIAAAGAGVGLITGGPSGGSTAGVVLALAAAAITTASLVLSRRLATTSSGLDGMAIAVAVAACLTLPVSAPAACATGAADELVLVAAVGLLGLAVPYALEYVAIRAVSLRTFSVLLSLDPACCAVHAWDAEDSTQAPAGALALARDRARAARVAERSRPGAAPACPPATRAAPGSTSRRATSPRCPGRAGSQARADERGAGARADEPARARSGRGRGGRTRDARRRRTPARRRPPPPAPRGRARAPGRPTG